MKAFLLILLSTAFVLAQANSEKNTTVKKTPSNFAIGTKASEAVTGVYFRKYNKTDYFQVVGLFTANNSDYSFSAEVGYGYYLYKDTLQAVYSVPYAIKMVTFLGARSERTSTEELNKTVLTDSYVIATGIGLGFEFFNPTSKGFMMEFSIDYVVIYEGPLQVKLSASGALGYNF